MRPEPVPLPTRPAVLLAAPEPPPEPQALNGLPADQQALRATEDYIEMAGYAERLRQQLGGLTGFVERLYTRDKKQQKGGPDGQ